MAGNTMFAIYSSDGSHICIERPYDVHKVPFRIGHIYFDIARQIRTGKQINFNVNRIGSGLVSVGPDRDGIVQFAVVIDYVQKIIFRDLGTESTFLKDKNQLHSYEKNVAVITHLINLGWEFKLLGNRELICKNAFRGYQCQNTSTECAEIKFTYGKQGLRDYLDRQKLLRE